jgi:hypothetical protein
MLMMQMILITNMGCYSSTHLTRISTPRFLGKKRGKGLQRSSMIFTNSPWSSFLKERGNNSGKMDLHKYWVSHGQLIEWVFVNISWANKHETPKSVRRNGKVSNLVRKFVSTFELYSQTIKKGKHWMCNMVVGKEGSTLVCFLLKHGFSCRYSMYRTLFYDISISLLKTIIEHF